MNSAIRIAAREAAIWQEPGLPANLACSVADAVLVEVLKQLSLRDGHLEFKKEIARVVLEIEGDSKGPWRHSPKARPVDELVALASWMDANLDMGFDRGQVADPAILARTEIYSRIVARIAELKGNS